MLISLSSVGNVHINKSSNLHHEFCCTKSKSKSKSLKNFNDERPCKWTDRAIIKTYRKPEADLP